MVKIGEHLKKVGQKPREIWPRPCCERCGSRCEASKSWEPTAISSCSAVLAVGKTGVGRHPVALLAM